MLEIIECEQNSDEWFRARMGIPSASQFKSILAKGEGKMRKAYMNRLAAEIISGEPMESFSSAAMERGHRMEDEARQYYAFLKDADPQRVGFVRNGQKGCSPDSFLGSDGILEIKTQRGDLLIETLEKDRFPLEHIAQVQGQIWIAEREWADIIVYWPGMPPLIKRATRDDAYISTISQAVDQFNDELAELVEKIRAYGHGPLVGAPSPPPAPTSAQPVMVPAEKLAYISPAVAALDAAQTLDELHSLKGRMSEAVAVCPSVRLAMERNRIRIEGNAA